MSKNISVVHADAPIMAQSQQPNNNPFGPLLDPQQYDMMMKVSDVFARSNMVPAHFKQRPADVFVTLQLAWRLNIDPMTALQSVYIVQGRPGLSASLVIALANRSGLFKGPITFEKTGKGNALSVTANAELVATGQIVSATVDMALAQAEKWTKNDKYRTMPEHMLIYRAATWLVRRYAPEVLLGMQTNEELRDIVAADTAERVDDTAEAVALEGTILACETAEQVKAVGQAMRRAFSDGKINADQKQHLIEVGTRQLAAIESAVDNDTGEIQPEKKLSDDNRRKLNQYIKNAGVTHDDVKRGLIAVGIIKTSTNELDDSALGQVLASLKHYAKLGALPELPELPDRLQPHLETLRAELKEAGMDAVKEALANFPDEDQAVLWPHLQQHEEVTL
ncbi:MAG: recombinase RecT [Woeseia sp.]|nr:recombinase RecT [Woeseia sp.]